MPNTKSSGNDNQSKGSKSSSGGKDDKRSFCGNDQRGGQSKTSSSSKRDSD